MQAGNVLVEEDGHVMLADFGAAAALQVNELHGAGPGPDSPASATTQAARELGLDPVRKLLPIDMCLSQLTMNTQRKLQEGAKGLSSPLITKAMPRTIWVLHAGP